MIVFFDTAATQLMRIAEADVYFAGADSALLAAAAAEGLVVEDVH